MVSDGVGTKAILLYSEEASSPPTVKLSLTISKVPAQSAIRADRLPKRAVPATFGDENIASREGFTFVEIVHLQKVDDFEPS
jgi:hypothetical protein